MRPEEDGLVTAFQRTFSDAEEVHDEVAEADQEARRLEAQLAANPAFRVRRKPQKKQMERLFEMKADARKVDPT